MSQPRLLCCRMLLVAVVALGVGRPALCTIVATDDASQAAYNDGWQVGDNGGSGYQPWSTITRENGSGFGGGFLSTGNGNVNIGSGGNNAAFGVFGNSGGVGVAVRPFSTPLQIGWTLSVDMDNQSIDNGGTVGFSLRNAAGNNLAEYLLYRRPIELHGQCLERERHHARFHSRWTPFDIHADLGEFLLDVD